MTDRERYIRTILGRDVDRPSYQPCYWTPWSTTWHRWRREGMPFADFDEVAAHVGADASRHAIPVNCGPCPPIETRTIEEDDRFRIWIDSWGIKRKNFKDAEGMSQFL